MKPTICSFYTDEYASLADRMIRSANRFQYETCIRNIKKINDNWLDTIYWRPEFLMKCLEELKTPIVWLDCDAVIEKNPILFESIEGDFAAHIRINKRGEKDVLGGTMYFAYNKRAFELLRTWIALNKSMPKQKLSQYVLREALKSWPGKMTVLPASYCRIFDLMSDCEPIISHYQASRKFRNG